jgi:hypothetical protein
VVTMLAQLLLAYPAGIGIGAFRPLGRHSHWLLLPFMPWLFVTVVPLAVVSWQSTVASKSLDSWLGAVSPILVSVPALVVFTLFSSGQGHRWRTELAAGRRGAFARTVLVPSLPLATLVGTVILLVEAHGMIWQLLVIQGHRSAATMLFQLVNQFAVGRPSVGLLVEAAPVAVPALVVLVVLQLLYTDRLTIRTGDPFPTDPVSANNAVPPGQPAPGPQAQPGLVGQPRPGAQPGPVPPAALGQWGAPGQTG